MNKKELAEKLANKCDLSKAKAQEVVSTLFDTVPIERRRRSLKKGGGGRKVPLPPDTAVLQGEMDELLALSEALEQLAEHNAELARVAELRLFGGLSVEETAKAADLTLRTAERHWASARRWLNERLESA